MTEAPLGRGTDDASLNAGAKMISVEKARALVQLFERITTSRDANAVANGFTGDCIVDLTVPTCTAEKRSEHIEFREGAVTETCDLDENTVLHVDASGDICAITVEHASDRTGMPDFSHEQIPAQP